MTESLIVLIKFEGKSQLTILTIERQAILCSMMLLGLSGSSDSSVRYAKVMCCQYFISFFLTTADLRWNFCYSINKYDYAIFKFDRLPVHDEIGIFFSLTDLPHNLSFLIALLENYVSNFHSTFLLQLQSK